MDTSPESRDAANESAADILQLLSDSELTLLQQIALVANVLGHLTAVAHMIGGKPASLLRAVTDRTSCAGYRQALQVIEEQQAELRRRAH